MLSAVRRVIVTDAHRRRTGRCPVLLHSLGTGESFAIDPAGDGFADVESGVRARCGPDGIRLNGRDELIPMTMEDSVAFSGVEPASGERFEVRAHGGASVTLFTGVDGAYWQFAVVEQD